MTQAASPTLSDMDFESAQLGESPESRVTERPVVSTTTKLDHSQSQPEQSANPPDHVQPGSRMTRYLPPDGKEAFIGPLLNTINDTKDLIQRECPSLQGIAHDDIYLKVRYDGSTAPVQNVLFKILDDSWPKAVKAVLPLVQIEVKHSKSLEPVRLEAIHAVPRRSASTELGVTVEDTSERKKETWDDLKMKGELLGEY